MLMMITAGTCVRANGTHKRGSAQPVSKRLRRESHTHALAGSRERTILMFGAGWVWEAEVVTSDPRVWREWGDRRSSRVVFNQRFLVVVLASLESLESLASLASFHRMAEYMCGAHVPNIYILHTSM